ncbi:MAG: hypothetical protein AAGJ54_10665 [Planctomycetota bacterium]
MDLPQPQHAPAQLWRVLAITFLLSVGTGSVTQGLYFIADATGQFDRPARFLLGVVMGAVYIPAALASGPVLRRVSAASAKTSPRAILAALVTLGGFAALVPPGVASTGADAAWSIWLTAVVYSVSTGLMWPIVEWYLSGGRKYAALRSATGKFNVTWTGAIVICFWLLFLFLERAPLNVLALLALLHAAGLIIVLGLPESPAPPLDHHEPHPPVYDRMLAVARRLLPTSYLLMSALSPYLVGALNSLEIKLKWQPVIASIWLVSRVAAMITLERWHGWHQSWLTHITGAVLLILGFAGCILAPAADSLALMLGSLAVFGAAMGIIYTAALYYALEVGGHSADAGGTHEALIGIGYTAGPTIGFASALAVASGIVPEHLFGSAIVTATIAASAAGYAVSGRRSHSKA